MTQRDLKGVFKSGIQEHVSVQKVKAIEKGLVSAFKTYVLGIDE